MKALVVYDSKFGNTARLAQVIATALGADEPAPAVAAMAATADDLAGLDLLAVGGPTQGHGLSPALVAYLDGLPPEAVRGLPVVTFDTRLPWPRFMSGSAAAASAKRLVTMGARLLVPPESFSVTGSDGPLAEGELARATAWAHAVATRAGLRAQEQASATVAQR